VREAWHDCYMRYGIMQEGNGKGVERTIYGTVSRQNHGVGGFLLFFRRCFIRSRAGAHYDWLRGLELELRRVLFSLIRTCFHCTMICLICIKNHTALIEQMLAFSRYPRASLHLVLHYYYLRLPKTAL
jgi:hypothetical protein